MADKLLTQGEVAEKLRKPPRTLERWRYQKYGPTYIKVGRDVRYRLSAVERWLAAQEQGSAAA